MTIQDLGVQYHQQDTDYYCGAACAQMALESIGTGILDQVGLYADNHSHSLLDPGWASGPDGLTWTMNDRKPGSFANYFVLFSLADEEAISRKIIWTIHHYGVAPIALVYGWAHWIVIRGYDASAAPATWDDTSYSINGFYVNNPWPPTPMPGPPPPHAGGDACGGGGDRGIADEHLSYATWQSTYMTGVPGGYWSGRFLAVCDPEPPPRGHGRRAPTERQFDGTQIIESGQAAELTMGALKRHGLLEQPSWREALEGAGPGRPQLVQRLDHVDSYYYIVPIGPSDDAVTAFAAVDARFGDYQQAAVLPDRRSNHLDFLERERSIEILADRRVELPHLAGELVLRPDLFCEYPILVWKPCRESLSPFYPFRMVTVGSHHVYIRSDGAVFTSLHEGQGL
jgi:hypothetical protein